LKKILIINPFGVGDVLFTTPVIREIKKAYPDSFIGYWCNIRVEEIFKAHPDINKTFALSRGDLKKIFQKSWIKGIKAFFYLLWNLKKMKFDTSIDFSLDHRYGFITKLIGIKKRIGFYYKNRGIFLTDKTELTGYDQKHAIEYYLELLKFLNIKPHSKNPEIFVSEKAKIQAKTILVQADLKDSDVIVGIAPGAGGSWGKNASLKHWPALKYAQLADKIIDTFKVKVVLLGDIQEKPIAEIISAAMKNKPYDLTAKTSLEELSAVISFLPLLITNDGGPLHIAAALNKKTISIFGPVDEKVYGPYPPAEKHIVIKTLLDCRPCYRKFKMAPCNKNRECINLITVDEVFEAVERQLK